MTASTSTLAPSATLLIVDDDTESLRVLNTLLKPHYQILAAPSGARALEIAARSPKPDLILLDVMMPGMDGYEVLARLRSTQTTQDIPVIFITGLDSTADEERGLQLGAVDYITKPYRPSIVLARVRTQLELKAAHDWLRAQNTHLEAEVARRLRDILLIQEVTINALAELAEMRDPETGNHIRRTQQYVRILAKRLKNHPRFATFLNDKRMALLIKSAPLHDIGKVGIPDPILLKPGQLTDEERAIMKTHTLLGAHAIERALAHAGQRVDFLDMAEEIAHYHHERWDGCGYPEGLSGEAIPISARIMALADAFDALVTRRPYKAPLTPEQAREIIVRERGRQFDPDVVAAFLADFTEFVTVAQHYSQNNRSKPWSHA